MEHRRPLIAGNWKMYKSRSDAAETAKRLVKLVADITNIDILVIPSFTALSHVSDVIKKSVVSLSAQDLFWESEGAYTGEISPLMLVSEGCKYVIVGHSERRQYFSETDEIINKKMKAAINHDLIPILCVGESKDERESQDTFNVLGRQLKRGIEGLSPDDLKTIVIAYEPVWAIGTGKAATSTQAQEAQQFLRSLLEKSLGKMVASSIRILYGGSVTPRNIKELMAMPDIDGVLVGTACLQAESFSELVHFQT